MSDKEILKLKVGFAAIALLLLVIGSKLLFAQWEAVTLLFWLLIGLLAYFGVYRSFRHLFSKNTQIIFIGFETAGTIAFAIVFALVTIMLLIFYPLVSLLFFGLALLILTVFFGLKFVTFDFDKNKVEGLFIDRDTSLAAMTVSIHPDNNEIEIKTADRDDIVVLKKEKFSSNAWSQLIDNFQKIDQRT